MANTEGLPDDFVESLSVLPPPSTTASSSSSSSLRQRQRLQARMELPLSSGQRPAARIIRHSNNNTRSIERDEDVVEETKEEEVKTTTLDSSSTNDGGILGSILEKTPVMIRRRRRGQRGTTKNTSSSLKTSRFLQSQQQPQGFPSVHVPLGTFCRGRQDGSATATNSNSNSNSNSSRRNIPTATTASSPSTISTTMATPPEDEIITTESLIRASKRDAQGILQGMTPAEILQEQASLTQMLSPEILSFLKERRQQRQAPQGQSALPAPVVPSSSNAPATPTPTASSLQENNKQRMAQVLSQVQTHQDLDDAYHEIMQDIHPLEQPPHQMSEDHPDSNDNKNNSFAMACDLLRSTNPRQTLWAARVVQRELSFRLSLQQQQQQHDDGVATRKTSQDWPLVLPVSLRCLLDQPLNGTATSSQYPPLLHTYVLQALNSLVCLQAHPSHVVVFPTTANTTTIMPPNTTGVFVECCMEDAIPTPPLHQAYAQAATTSIQPLTMENDDKQPKAAAAAAAYMTQSSSTSAQSDGQAFETDPLWTLLSKMKLLPRLADFLTQEEWPIEAWMSILDILAMMAQRSPGAASAMAHHATLVPNIVARILPCLQQVEQQDQEDTTKTNGDWMIVMGTLQFMTILARQSRVAAKALPLSEVLPPLLMASSSSSSSTRSTMSQQIAAATAAGIQLWRTVLRYGEGLEAMEVMMTAAAKHWALPYSHANSLSTEFVAALVPLVELAKLYQLKGDKLQGQDQDHNNGLAMLSNVSNYLTATLQTTLLTPTKADTCAVIDGEVGYLRWNAARMRFLANYLQYEEVCEEEPQQDSVWLTMEQLLVCLETLDEWTDEENLVDQSWKSLSRYNTATVKHSYAKDLRQEAAAASFLVAFVQLLLAIATYRRMTNNRMIQEMARSVSKNFKKRILSVSAPTEDLMGANTPLSLAQLGWINQSHFAVCKVMAHCHTIGIPWTSAEIQRTRQLAFSLMGRLQKGDESIAAVLWSQDFLFRTTTTPIEADEYTARTNATTAEASPISSMFLGELCGSEQSRKQLDHSFKLQHGFGVTQEGLGAFALDSLLSSADQQPTPAAASSLSSDLSLPLGPMWLWQSLSGQVRTQEERRVGQGLEEAVQVVTSVLALLLEMEEIDDVAAGSGSAPLGSKLYYIMNVCLHAEGVLREDCVLSRAESLLDLFWSQVVAAKTGDVIADFAKECKVHTDPRKKSEEDLEDKDRKLLELFDPEVPNEVSLSKEEMRSLEAFLDDMVEAYNDYGAQYEFFTKCVRLFLLPVFPAAIRCRALRDLRGVLHLLSLPFEVERPSDSLSYLLRVSLSTQPRDPPQVLDTLTALMAPNSCPRPLMGFVQGYAIGIMSRGLLTALTLEEGVDVMTKRLLQMEQGHVQSIFDVLGAMMMTGSPRTDLVPFVLQTLEEAPRPALTSTTPSVMPPVELNERLASLRAQIQNK